MERLKGVFSVYSRCGHIGTGDKVPITINQKQEPLLPPDVVKAIKEREQRERNGEGSDTPPPPDSKKQKPLFPPPFYIKPNKQ